MRAFAWLTRTGQLWKLQAEAWAALLGFVGIILNLIFLLAAIAIDPAATWLVGLIWAVYGLVAFGASWLKYHRIRCPRCGRNPTRDPDSGRWLGGDEVHECLAALEVCPGCEFRGSGGPPAPGDAGAPSGSDDRVE